MVDIKRHTLNANRQRRFKDMGDGTFAEIVAVGDIFVNKTNPLPVAAFGGGNEYISVPAGASQILGATGAAGDYIDGLLCIVDTPATSKVEIKDGDNAAITVFPANPGGGIGSYYLDIHARSVDGGWTVIAGAGVSVFATGDFT